MLQALSEQADCTDLWCYVCSIEMTADKAPEWDDDVAPSRSLKLFKLSSTSVKSWSTPELRAEGVLGESGCEDGFCMVCMGVVSNTSNRRRKPIW